MNALVGGNVAEAYDADELAASGKGFGLGDRLCRHDGKEYVWVQANGAVTGAGYVVALDEAYQAVEATNTTALYGDLVGVALVAMADNDYGWVQVKGPCVIQGAASCAANVVITSTTTAGQLDDAAGVGTKTINGAALTAAVGGSAATAAAMINYPQVGATN
jgi:hypothetical protein